MDISMINLYEIAEKSFDKNIPYTALFSHTITLKVTS